MPLLEQLSPVRECGDDDSDDIFGDDAAWAAEAVGPQEAPPGPPAPLRMHRRIHDLPEEEVPPEAPRAPQPQRSGVASAAALLEPAFVALQAPSLRGWREKQKVSRALIAVQRVLDVQQSGVQALTCAWDHAKLRVGELCIGTELACGPREKGCHPNTWTLGGSVRAAYAAVGQMPASAANQTKKSSELVSGVALAASSALAEQVNRVFDPVCAGASQVSWCMLQLSFDATPVDVTFGSLCDVVSAYARYWWREGRGADWSLLSEKEFQRLSGVKKARHGVLELLAVQADLHWDEPAVAQGISAKHDEILPLAPMFLQRGSSSVFWEAVLVEAMPFLSFDRMRAAADKLRFFVLPVYTDLCAANSRMKVDPFLPLSRLQGCLASTLEVQSKLSSAANPRPWPAASKNIG